MLIDYEFDNYNKKLIVSYINIKGVWKIERLDWPNPHNWVINVDSRQENISTWKGKGVMLQPTNRPNKYAILDFLESQPDADRFFAYNNDPDVFFIDIETEVTDGFPTPQLAPNAVTTIALCHRNKVWSLGWKPLSDSQKESIQRSCDTYMKKYNEKIDIEFIIFDNEISMLHYFFDKMVKSSKMHIITGWNFVGFDWLYLINRYKKFNLNPDQFFPTQKMVMGRIKTRKDFIEIPMPLHKVVCDYMELYQKWDTSVKVKESASLDFVANKLLGANKIHYAGTLQQLYENDYEKYVFYNIIDTVLVRMIHDKKGYLKIMGSIGTQARIRMQDSLSTINVTEGILRKAYKKNEGIIFAKDFNSNDVLEEEGKIEGGYVKDPITGLHAYVSVCDFNSLYPTTMRTFNMGPDSFKGIVPAIATAFENKELEEWGWRNRFPEKLLCYMEGKEIEVLPTDFVCVNGAVFSSDRDCTTKIILSDTYSNRKANQKIKAKKLEEYDLVKKERLEKEKELELLLAQY